jgi:hypothetical protein
MNSRGQIAVGSHHPSRPLRPLPGRAARPVLIVSLACGGGFRQAVDSAKGPEARRHSCGLASPQIAAADLIEQVGGVPGVLIGQLQEPRRGQNVGLRCGPVRPGNDRQCDRLRQAPFVICAVHAGTMPETRDSAPLQIEVLAQ